MKTAKLPTFALLVASYTVAAPAGTAFTYQDRLDVGGSLGDGSYNHNSVFKKKDVYDNNDQ